MKQITVTVDGGLVEDVTDIPPGVSVRVVDFDAGQGIDDENAIEVGGRQAWVSEYEGPPGVFEHEARLWVVYSQYDGADGELGPAHATHDLAVAAMWAALEGGPTGETQESILGSYKDRAKIERGDVLIDEFDPNCPDWLDVGKHSMRVFAVEVPAELLR